MKKMIYIKPDSALVSMALFLPVQLEHDFAVLCKEWYDEEDSYYNHLAELQKAAAEGKERSNFVRSQTRLCKLLRQYEGTKKEDIVIQQEALNV